jgi:hypothetical protein
MGCCNVTDLLSFHLIKLIGSNQNMLCSNINETIFRIITPVSVFITVSGNLMLLKVSSFVERGAFLT